MTVEKIELFLCRLPLVQFFETSFGRSYDRTFVLVRVVGDGHEGWGESVAEANPYYSSETTETVWHIIAGFIAPLIIGTRFEHPRDVYAALKRIRGHNMAKAGVEMAMWDLYARMQGQPLATVLGGTRRRIASGVSIGIQDSFDQLLEKIDRELSAGYQRIKIKIKPGWDIEAVERVRARFGNIPLQVDANAAYSLDDAALLARLDPHDLLLIEQPLDYDDVMDHAVLQARITTPVCLDESIHTVRIARDAIDAKACRIINIKPGRVGGHQASIELHDLCASHGIAVWHGGMLESGIGRAHNIHLASLPNFSLPGDIAASRRYYQPDLIEPAIDIAKDGTIAVPQGPGIGVNIVSERIAMATLRHLSL
ncbi:MAG: o-succinylbenzoate synthase [Acidimicrobiia bacterium]|nr:o-succinylbenzoate synthase [Acidimicrobiia bacterium]